MCAQPTDMSTVEQIDIHKEAPADLFRQPGQVLPIIRTELKNYRQTIDTAFRQGAAIKPLVNAYSHYIDSLLVVIWKHFLKDCHNDEIALIAVGGYGRNELHPSSDIDLLILLRANSHENYRDSLEALLVFLWDIGLDIGHSVRSLEECRHEAEQDITIATNLMESRLLSGPANLYLHLREETGPDKIWPGPAFFKAKWHEQQQRHKKYNDTAYNLEPNVKAGPGGLRDIQMIGWVAKRHFGVNTLSKLVDHDFLKQREYQALIEGQHFLWRVRFGLHSLAGRREDRLLFDYQKELAQLLGYSDDAGKRLAVEQFMKDYYRTVTELSRLNELLLQLFQEAILYGDQPTICTPINKRFHSCNDFIEASYPQVFKRYPFALLEVFLLLEQNPHLKGVRATTIRLIRNHRHLIDNDFRNDLRSRSLFMEIFRAPQGLTHELRRMNRYGILAAYLPVFAKIVGQMQYDLFHVYTVDDHSLMVLRNLRRLTIPEFVDELPFCSQLIQRIPKPELLYLAALFHDIAKGRGGDHSELGAEETTRFCHHHHLSQYDTDLVTWLVKNHLILSDTAQRKDVSDPDIINAFANQVENPLLLDYLYLLTVADIRGTSPDLWNNWKGSLLFELYQATQRILRHGPDQASRELFINETRNEALKELILSVDEATIQAFWCSLDDEYFLRNHASEVIWQTRAICQTPDDQLPLVIIREVTQRGVTDIFIYTQDRELLFAICTHVIEQVGLTIVDARIATTSDGFALDTFAVLDASNEPIRDPRRIDEIETQLHQSLQKKDQATFAIKRRPPRQLKHFALAPVVEFEHDNNKGHTIMYLSATDRPGLLAGIALIMARHAIHIHNAKIATYGARVEDSFIITTLNEQVITDEAVLETLRQAILSSLNEDTE